MIKLLVSSVVLVISGVAFANPELITQEQANIVREFAGKHKVISCEFTKTINAVVDPKVRPCDAEIAEIQYAAPSDYYLNFYMLKGANPHGGGTYIYGRRAWVKHTGCLQLKEGDPTVCYDIKPGSWHEEMSYEKASCIAGENETAHLVWDIKKNLDGTYTLTFDDQNYGVYCKQDGSLDVRQSVVNIMKLTFVK